MKKIFLLAVNEKPEALTKKIDVMVNNTTGIFKFILFKKCNYEANKKPFDNRLYSL